jgi:hypothetical protein
MNDLALMQYNGNALRTKQYKDINLYVVKDILRNIVDADDLDTYWKELKIQLDSEGFDIYCEISSFCFEDGMQECADRATIFRIVQSINSPQAEMFKQWFAEIAEEKIEEYMNPALAIERARDRYLERGYSPEWIDSRIKSIITHSQLLDEWKERGATSKDNEKLANTISQETFGITIKQHKEIKQITEGSLRDNMSQMELLINSLAELTTSELHKSNNSQGVDELYADAVKGGQAANFAKKQIETTLGKPVVTSENALHYTQPKHLK